jgi:hypothetical protein
MDKRWLGVVAVGMLAGCGDERDPTVAFCGALAGTPTLTCNAGCTVTNGANASDEDLDTFAALTPNPGETSATVTFTTPTQANDVAAGSVPGVFVTQPSSVTITDTAIKVYQDGGVNPVHTSANAEDRFVQDVESGSGAAGYLGLLNTPAFDKVEFTTTYTWTAGTPVYYIYEICADGGND